jgi:hypothetical protein
MRLLTVISFDVLQRKFDNAGDELSMGSGACRKFLSDAPASDAAVACCTLLRLAHTNTATQHLTPPPNIYYSRHIVGTKDAAYWVNILVFNRVTQVPQLVLHAVA